MISPELVPSAPGSAEAALHTEAAIGPFDLQDFHLYHLSRFGWPSKLAFLVLHAWRDRARGTWPALVPEAQRVAYTLPEKIRDLARRVPATLRARQ